MAYHKLAHTFSLYLIGPKFAKLGLAVMGLGCTSFQRYPISTTKPVFNVFMVLLLKFPVKIMYINCIVSWFLPSITIKIILVLYL